MMGLNIKEIKTLDYQRPEIEKGYTNQHLDIDLSTSTIAIEPILPETKKTFVGG